MKKLTFLFLLVLLNSFCFSKELIVINNLSLYADNQNLNFLDIKEKEFDKLSKNHVNFGFNNKITSWLRFELVNNSTENMENILEINNPLLEEVILYSSNKILSKSGMLNIKDNRTTINPSFIINLDSNTKKTFYLHIINKTTALQFSINIIEKKQFYKKDRTKQFLIILFIGMIISFLVYASALYIYTKDISYLFYSLYIVTLLFQQLTYVGFLPLYMPYYFTYIDDLIVVPKVGAIIITGILFARSFLKTSKYKNIDKIYKIIIYFVILQIIFLSTPWFYYPEATVLTGLVFIVFNYYAAIYVYKKGNKQARFFIAGWSFLLIGFFLSIIDALGIYSVMYHMPSLVLLFTTFEALFLLLAFVDKLSILQKQKNIVDTKLVEELQTRNIVIEQKVSSRTKMLNNLYRELHHRVKNNLQIILSIIRLQSNKFDDKVLKEQFLKLENRIKAIAKTHEILYLNDDIEKIDMYEYIFSLCEDIDASFNNRNIEFDINSNVKMPLKTAVYLGIIINELVSNSMKYAKTCTRIIINLEEKNSIFYLYVYDNGKGYESKSISDKSLGLKLVNNLVKDQLDGSIEVNKTNKCEYKIRFEI